MGVRILAGKADGDRCAACLFDSVTGTAFGPLFACGDEAEAFLDVYVPVHGDPRDATGEALHEALARFRAARAA